MPATDWLNLTIGRLEKIRRYIPAVLTLCGGIGLSIGACFVVWNWEQTRTQTELKDRLTVTASALQKDMESKIALLRATSAFYTASNDIDSQEFQTFVKSALYWHPGIQMVAWVPRVKDEERQDYESKFFREDKGDFYLSEKMLSQEIVAAEKRPEYFPIEQVVSLTKNEKIIGLDLGNLPFKTPPIETAIVRGEIIVTSQINLEINSNHQSRFLVFIPIYNPGLNDTEKLRRQNLRGFVVGLFEIPEILRLALQEKQFGNSFHFYLEDAMAAENHKFMAFYDANKQQISTDGKNQNWSQIKQIAFCGDGTACTRIVQIENRRWLLQLLVDKNYNFPQKYWRSGGTFLFGLFLTAIAFIYLIVLQKRTQEIEKIASEKTKQSQELKKALQELQETQSQLIHTEKMSSLGQLVAGVAHEINNPINFIYGNLSHADQYVQDLIKLIHLYQQHCNSNIPEIEAYREDIEFDFLIQDMPKLLASMKVGADRIRELVLSLRNFSRLDESDIKLVNLHEGIESTLMILQNRLKATESFPAIEVFKNYENLPLVECYSGKINQVFMNLLSNAIDALQTTIETDKTRAITKELSHSGLNSSSQISIALANRNHIKTQENFKPKITISTEVWQNNHVRVKISDNGSGMTENIQKHIFNPFFTTKPVGKGTGLGLSISYQIIVEKHGGKLSCNSTLGEGTEFCIELPIRKQISRGT
ncbi:MAG TPA: CHASE domain-containing protein [Halomicronema sp.]